MELNFNIPGEPCAQGRPRFTTINGHVRAYDPTKSRNYKSFVKMLALAAVKEQDWMYTELPVFITITCYLPVAKSKSKKYREAALAGEIFPTRKPDVDNVFKTITDALSGIAYKDDKQIVYACINKLYGSEPLVKVLVTAKDKKENEGTR